MKRFIVQVIVPETGQIQHVTKAKSKQDAKNRIVRAYPNRILQFISVIG